MYDQCSVTYFGRNIVHDQYSVTYFARNIVYDQSSVTYFGHNIVYDQYSVTYFRHNLVYDQCSVTYFGHNIVHDVMSNISCISSSWPIFIVVWLFFPCETELSFSITEWLEQLQASLTQKMGDNYHLCECGTVIICATQFIFLFSLFHTHTITHTTSQRK